MLIYFCFRRTTCKLLITDINHEISLQLYQIIIIYYYYHRTIKLMLLVIYNAHFLFTNTLSEFLSIDLNSSASYLLPLRCDIYRSPSCSIDVRISTELSSSNNITPSVSNIRYSLRMMTCNFCTSSST